MAQRYVFGASPHPTPDMEVGVTDPDRFTADTEQARGIIERLYSGGRRETEPDEPVGDDGDCGRAEP